MLLSVGSIWGQSTGLSNLRYHYLAAESDTVIEEKNSIIQSSVQWISDDTKPVAINIDNNRIVFQNPAGGPGILKYRIYDFNLFVGRSVLDSSSIAMDERVMLLKTPDENTSFSRRFIESSSIQYRGNFTRGISFGNTQDLVLNSNLNLQLSGDLGDGLLLTAAISDENIPLQPDGNTQVLQDFNKVFIELRKDNIAVTAGDYELGRPSSYFMNYYKKLKGLSVESSHNTIGNWQINNKASFAVSRGKFRRIMLETQEGNQGPYRLSGENGEVFLQVLSGTERVYADGRLLTRGENNDYIIDYNRAEIRFTPRAIITTNLRIIIEFEYAVQSYQRSLLASETSFQNESWDIKINAYSEQDSKSTSGNVSLDSTDLKILREGGDDETFKSGIFPVTDNTPSDLVRYSLDSGILQYTPFDSLNTYTARFSNVGIRNGDYIIDENAGANGRVYNYVGQGMGEYLPLVRLVPPEQKQMFTASAKYNVSDSTSIFIEAAMTNLDRNRFSEMDNEDNSSLGFKAIMNDKRKLKTNSSWHISSNAEFEYLAKDFQPLNPFRPQEFIRDWNLDNSVNRERQVLGGGSVMLSDENKYISYEINKFDEKGIYSGTRHRNEVLYDDKGWYLKLIGNWLNSNLNGVESSFFRPRVNLKRELVGNALSIGGYLEKERNIIKADTDSIVGSSFNYDLYRVFLESRVSGNINLRLALSTRTDDRVLDDELIRVTEGRNLEFGGNWRTKKSSDLQWQFVLRDYSVEDIYLDQDEPRKAFIGNLNHKLKLFSGALSVNSFYESNSGQEPKIEFQFVQVQRGEGSYIWNDYNQDSIQQINEFEIAPFSDLASFEKISVFNNEFINTNRNVLNQSIRLDLKRMLRNKKSILSRLYFFSRYRIDQKNQATEGSSFYNFIDFDHNDPTLVSFNSSFDHSIFINRGKPDWDLQFSYRSINNKILQIVGFDQRLSKRYYSRARYNIKRFFDAILEFEIGNKDRNSENFNSQNFQIEVWEISPQLNYRPSSKWRFISAFAYSFQSNQMGLEESAKKTELSFDLSWRNSTYSSLELGFEFVNFEFAGETNSPVEFEMLQGLRNGRNVLWRLSYIKRISNSIDLVLNYNGRKSQDSRTINTATMQMRAIF